MTPRLIIRPVLACLAAGALSACGMVDSDPHRFENLAETVAAIPLDGPAARQASTGRMMRRGVISPPWHAGL